MRPHQEQDETIVVEEFANWPKQNRRKPRPLVRSCVRVQNGHADRNPVGNQMFSEGLTLLVGEFGEYVPCSRFQVIRCKVLLRGNYWL